jgi:hypothetical protein
LAVGKAWGCWRSRSFLLCEDATAYNGKWRWKPSPPTLRP